MKQLSILFFFLPVIGFSQNQLLDLIDHFEQDSLHVYPSKYSNLKSFINDGRPLTFNGSEIPIETLKTYHICDTHPSGTDFYALDKVDLGASLYGLIVGIKTTNILDSKIGIWIMNTATDSIMEKVNLAYFKSIPGTMDETMNGWILDLDMDGDLDIGIMVALNDYELPNEFAENIIC